MTLSMNTILQIEKYHVFYVLLECRVHSRGYDYQGTVARTTTGLPCQRWDQQTPHRHMFTEVILVNSPKNKVHTFVESSTQN